MARSVLVGTSFVLCQQFLCHPWPRRSCRIKLADFGIAKLVEAATLKAHTLVGTHGAWSSAKIVLLTF